MFLDVPLIDAKRLLPLLTQEGFGDLAAQLQRKLEALEEPDEYAEDCKRMGVCL